MRKVHLGFLAVMVLCLAPGTLGADDEQGDGVRPVAPPQRRSSQRPERRGDLPDQRREWFLSQRSYPDGHLPGNAYSAAAEHYVAARAAARRRAAEDGLPNATWREVGPAPMLNNIFTYGNVTGRISTVALHPSDPNIALAGGSAGGIWRTGNAQSAPPTWTPVGDDLPTLAIADIEFAPSDPSIAYAASGDDDISLWGAGIFKTTDGGLTWQRIDDGSAATGVPDGTYLSKIAVHASDPDRVVALGRGEVTAGATIGTSIFLSSDGGTTWGRAPLPGGGTVSRFRELVAEPGCADRLWAVDYPNREIIRSTDFGSTWQTIPANGLPAFTSNTKLAVFHADCNGPATIYASVYSGSSLAGDPARYAGVYVSNDDGASWALPGGTAGPSGGCLAQCGYDHEMAIDPLDASRVYMIGRDFWASEDGGATWVNRSGGFSNSNMYSGGRMHVDLHVVEVQGSGASATIWIAGDGGIWTYSVATDTFTNRVGNLATTEFVDLAMHPETPDLAIGGLQDNGTIMYDGRTTWPTVLHGDGGFSGFVRNTSGSGIPFDGAFTSYVYESAYHSTDRGTNFNSFTDAGTFANENNEFYPPWIGTDNRLWHGAESLWYCDWPVECNPFTQLSPNLAAMTASQYVSKLSIHMQSPGVYGPFYAGTASARGFLQSDDGVTWRVRTGTLPNRYIERIVHDPGRPASVWVVLSGFGTGHVWYSPDGGQNWANRSGDLPDVPVNVILLDPADRQNTWMVGTDVGVYGSTDAGTTWSVVGTNLPAVLVSDLEYGADGMIYAATGGRSAWAIPCTSEPAMVTATAAGDNRIALTWAGNPLSYQIERSVGGCSGPFTPLATVVAPPFQYTDTAVSGGVPYGYVIRTLDSCGSAAAACVEATTTGACTLDPTFAGAVQAAGRGGTCAIRVTWEGAGVLCGGPVVYNIYRDTDPAFLPDPSNRIASCVTDLFHLDSSNVLSGTAYTYVVRAESTTVAGPGPCGGREEANLARVTGVPEAVHRTDFETGPSGWTMSLGVPPASSGDYVHGDPDGTVSGGAPAQPEDDHTVAGVNCLFTAPNPNGPGGDDVDGGEVIATSPPFDASALTQLQLSLWRWHFLRDLGEDDSFVLEVSSDDGMNWTQVERLGPTQSANAWTEVTADLATLVPLTAAMRVRVRTADGSGDTNIVESAIDDILIASPVACQGGCATLVRVGNTLLGVRRGADVELAWTDLQPSIDGWSLYRSSAKTTTGSGIGSPVTPTYLDVGAMPAQVFFYNVVAVCAGAEGPF